MNNLDFKCVQRSLKHHQVYAQITTLQNTFDTYFNTNPIVSFGKAPTMTITIRDDVVRCFSHKSTMICVFELETTTPVTRQWMLGLVISIKFTCTCSFEVHVRNEVIQK